MMRMSEKLRKLWNEYQLDQLLTNIVLEPRLHDLIHAPFVRESGCLLLQPLVTQATRPEAFPDLTGYEAFVNKVHIDDYVDVADNEQQRGLRVLVQQGAKSATELAARLASEGSYRVVMSLDIESLTLTLRFFERRAGEQWSADDPDAFQLEEVLMIDT